MDDGTWVSLGVALMGLGGVVAGIVGIALPEGRRLGALFALIVGGGVGVALLGVGALSNAPAGPSGFSFFLAASAGLVSVCVASWFVWRRWTAERVSSAGDPAR
jgi:hypothetical protein